VLPSESPAASTTHAFTEAQRMMHGQGRERPRMSIEGHWTSDSHRSQAIRCSENQAESSRCAGQLVVGEIWTYYLGNYQLVGERLTLRLNVVVHFTEGGESILG
jgi:hypothetical protein